MSSENQETADSTPRELADEIDLFARKMDADKAPLGPWPDADLLREWAQIVRGFKGS